MHCGGTLAAGSRLRRPALTRELWLAWLAFDLAGIIPLAELERVRATPLAICNRRALISGNPSDCALRIHPSLPIQDVTLLGEPADYAHKSVSFDLGCLGIAIGLGSPFRYQVDDHQTVCLHLSFGGLGRIEIDGQHFNANLDQPGLYLPGEAYRCEIRNPHGLLITTQVESIATQALILAEEAGLDHLDLSLLQRPVAIGAGQDAHRQLLGLMRKTLSLLDVGQGLGPDFGNRVPLSRDPGVTPGQNPHQGFSQLDWSSSSSGAFGDRQDKAIASLLCRQIAAMVYPQLVGGARS